MIRSHFARVFQNKVICKKTVSKGWCKERRHIIIIVFYQNHIHVALIVTSVIIFMLFVQFCASHCS